MFWGTGINHLAVVRAGGRRRRPAGRPGARVTAELHIREANATRLAAREAKPQAIAALLPQLNGTAGYDKNKFEGTSDQAQIVSDGPNAGQITIFGTWVHASRRRSPGRSI